MSALAETRIAEPGGRDRTVIALVAGVHGVSHFFHLVLAPLFPWLKDAFSLSYSELGLLMTVFFVVSGVGQALAGFLVDRVGPLPVLQAALGLFALAGVVLASSQGYAGLVAGAVLAGLGNAPFHPVDYSIINGRVAPARLGHAYAMHGISGSLGWAAAPMLLVAVASGAGWREAFVAAAVVALLASAAVWRWRDALRMAPAARRVPAGAVPAKAGPATRDGAAAGEGAQPAAESPFAFMRLPAVWLSFAFFLTTAVALGGVQSFGTEAARKLHEVPVGFVAFCLTAYMLASAGGMLFGGVLARDPDRAERVIAVAFGAAATVAVSMALAPWPGWAVPGLFALMGFCSGVANPSRDLIVRRAAPPGATGRVYGVVYSGLDVGLAFAPAAFGLLMDAGSPSGVWLGIALFQGLLIASAFKAGAAGRRARAAAASAR